MAPASAASIEQPPNDHRVAKVFLGVAGIAGMVAWFFVGGLVLFEVLAVVGGDPEGMTTLAVVVLLPFPLVRALGLTAATALIYRTIRGGGRTLLGVAIVAVVVALPSLCWGTVTTFPGL